MPEGPPKSAIEIAMAKLAQQDAEGGTERVALSDAQKAAIAAARRDHEAKVAECRILHESTLATTFDPVARQTLEQEHRRDLDRFTSMRDKKIARITAGGTERDAKKP